MKTVAFAWELGRGLGHLMTMRRIARASRLMAFARRRRSATRRGRSRCAERSTGWSLRRPGRFMRAPPHSARHRRRRSTTSFGAGRADGAAVDRLLAAWDELFRQTRPALVIADFAPAAALAARGRVPLVLVGDGYTLPPHEMRRFPLLHRATPPVCNEERDACRSQPGGAELRLVADRLTCRNFSAAMLAWSRLPPARSVRHAANGGSWTGRFWIGFRASRAADAT